MAEEGCPPLRSQPLSMLLASRLLAPQSWSPHFTDQSYAPAQMRSLTVVYQYGILCLS